MDVTLGPWTADMSVAANDRKPLTDAMGDEAWNTVNKVAGFTPKKAGKGKPGKGFTIFGRLTHVVRNGRSVEVLAKFNVLVDGALSNVAMLDGRASADGSSTAEDALRAVTESRINTLLQAIKQGRVARLS